MARLVIKGERRNVADRMACRLVAQVIRDKGDLTEAQIRHHLSAEGIEFESRLRGCLGECNSLGIVVQPSRGKWRAL